MTIPFPGPYPLGLVPVITLAKVWVDLQYSIAGAYPGSRRQMFHCPKEALTWWNFPMGYSRHCNWAVIQLIQIHRYANCTISLFGTVLAFLEHTAQKTVKTAHQSLDHIHPCLYVGFWPRNTLNYLDLPSRVNERCRCLLQAGWVAEMAVDRSGNYTCISSSIYFQFY